MPQRELGVWCFDELAGTLVDHRDRLEFRYDQNWLASDRPPLSQSLPLSGAFPDSAVGAFFGGLLPEGAPRQLLARRLGVSVDNDFGLLEQLAGDTAGAVSLLAPGAIPGPQGTDVHWLTDDGLADLIEGLPTRPMHAGERGEYRLSLAGVQDKLPVVLDDAGHVGLTKGRTPSTHILKIPIPRLDDTVANEAFCLAVGRALGIHTAQATPRRVGEHEFLLVERYDRAVVDGATRRLHQEDFCQALGIPSARKYQSEGGPTLADCFGLLRRAAAIPAQEAVQLLDYVALSFLVANHDAHGKNYSVLYTPESSRAVLA
ncbi:MAG: HipA domain-containing protein, partial [Solirubrobacteraceae bacterium]